MSSVQCLQVCPPIAITMKLILALVGLAVCIGFRSVDSTPAPAPGKLFAYPWTQWLKLRPPPGGAAAVALAPQTAAPTAADSADSSSGETISEDELLSYLKRSILPVPKKKEKVKAALTGDTETTTKKPKLDLGDVAGLWTPPTDATTNLTSPVVIDPAFWAAKKTMFISRLFAALAKQVLNSTGEVTTTTETPNAALLKEIDTALLTEAVRSVVESEEAGAPVNPFAAKFKPKAKAKKAKKVKPTKAPKVAAPVEAATPTPHPTLDYSLLAKALLS